MVEEKKIEKVNEILESMVSTYNGYSGDVFSELKFDYTIHIDNQRPMISVGEYYDHLFVNLLNVKFNDDYTEEVFKVITNGLKTKRLSDISLATVNFLRREIIEEFKYFFNDDVRIVLYGIEFDKGLLDD